MSAYGVKNYADFENDVGDTVFQRLEAPVIWNVNGILFRKIFIHSD